MKQITKPAAENPYRLTWPQFVELYGEDGALLLVEEALFDQSACPALCTEGCDVEPDGACPHGCPSVLLAIGMI